MKTLFHSHPPFSSTPPFLFAAVGPPTSSSDGDGFQRPSDRRRRGIQEGEMGYKGEGGRGGDSADQG